MSKTAQRKRNSKQFMQGFYQEGYKLGLKGLPIGTGRRNNATDNYEQLGHKHGIAENLRRKEALLAEIKNVLPNDLPDSIPFKGSIETTQEKARKENHEEVN